LLKSRHQPAWERRRVSGSDDRRDVCDHRAGSDKLLAQVVAVFGAARPHHAYSFANRRATRRKVLAHQGIGIWMAARRLHQGSFVWPSIKRTTAQQTRAQFNTR
jgi:transposase